VWIARPVSTATAAARARTSPRSAGSSGSAGSSARRPIRRPRVSLSACRTSWSVPLSRGRRRERAGLRAAARRMVRWAREQPLHRTLRCRPIDRLIEERAVMTPLPAPGARHRSTSGAQVPPDPYLRFDTRDYSLDPAFVGRIEARARDYSPTIRSVTSSPSTSVSVTS
jgi:hypothetical protein